MSIGSVGSICKCGLAKSYHPRLAIDHEYEPRYPMTPDPRDSDWLTVEEDPPIDRPARRLWPLIAIVLVALLVVLLALGRAGG